MSFSITILGCSSAIPTTSRNPAAQLVNLLGRFFLIDCGEGTQVQLRKYKIKIQKIDHICISHLHGDHYLGLVGLISTMSLLGRKKELTIYAPRGLDKILDLHFKLSYSKLSFGVNIIQLKNNELTNLFEDDACILYSFGLNHRIPCWGFKLVEKKRPKTILKNMIDKFNIPFSEINSIKSGSDFITEDGQLIENNKITKDSYLPRSYAYCSDTYYFKSLVNYIKNVDLLYHESTFHSSLSDLAKSTFHSTSQDAAKIAKDGNVKELILGHFSSRYKKLNILKKDAESIFKNVHLAVQGKTWMIKKIYD